MPLLILGYLSLSLTLVCSQSMTPEDAKAILDKHNEYRRAESSANMYQMHWNISLQERADGWAQRCHFKHERNIDVGENLYYEGGLGNDGFLRGMKMWHDEKTVWRYTSQSCTTTCHYTQMVSSFTTTIGCSASVCPSLRVGSQSIEDAMFFVCYYYPRGNVGGIFPFDHGAPCSKCGEGDTCSNQLCVSSSQESKTAPRFIKQLRPMKPISPHRPIKSLSAFKALVQTFGSSHQTQTRVVPAASGSNRHHSHHHQRHHHQHYISQLGESDRVAVEQHVKPVAQPLTQTRHAVGSDDRKQVNSRYDHHDYRKKENIRLKHEEEKKRQEQRRLQENARRLNEKREQEMLRFAALRKQEAQQFRKNREQELQRRLEEERKEEKERQARIYLEKNRLEKERLERERREKERLQFEIKEKERLRMERQEKERLENERREQERLENERREQERLENERREQERLENERREQERLENERREEERLENERREQERMEKERLETERLETKRLETKRLEKERLENERQEKERLNNERLRSKRLEEKRLEKDGLETKRLETKRLEKERLENERLETKRLEKEHLETKRIEKERLEKERLEKERLETKRLEKERLETERLETKRLEKERLETKRLEKERLETKRLEKERLEKQRLGKERLELERQERERQKQKRQEMEQQSKEHFSQENQENEHTENKILSNEINHNGGSKTRVEQVREEIILRRSDSENTFDGQNLKLNNVVQNIRNHKNHHQHRDHISTNRIDISQTVDDQLQVTGSTSSARVPHSNTHVTQTSNHISKDHHYDMDKTAADRRVSNSTKSPTHSYQTSATKLSKPSMAPPTTTTVHTSSTFLETTESTQRTNMNSTVYDNNNVNKQLSATSVNSVLSLSLNNKHNVNSPTSHILPSNSNQNTRQLHNSNHVTLPRTHQITSGSNWRNTKKGFIATIVKIRPRIPSEQTNANDSLNVVTTHAKQNSKITDNNAIKVENTKLSNYANPISNENETVNYVTPNKPKKGQLRYKMSRRAIKRAERRRKRLHKQIMAKLKKERHPHKKKFVFDHTGRRCVDRLPRCSMWVAKCHKSAVVTLSCPLSCGKCGQHVDISTILRDGSDHDSDLFYQRHQKNQSVPKRRHKKKKKNVSNEAGEPQALIFDPSKQASPHDKPSQKLQKRRLRQRSRKERKTKRKNKGSKKRHRQNQNGLCRDDPNYIRTCKFWAKRGFCKDNYILKSVYCRWTCGEC